jgi:putative flippase GtrA
MIVYSFLKRFLNAKNLSFILVGLGVAGISYALLYLFIDVCQWNENISNIAQTVLCVELNFILNNFITWREKGGPGFSPRLFLKKYLLFHASKVFIFILIQINFAILIIFLNYMIVNTINIIVSFLISYVVNDAIVFTKRNKNDLGKIGAIERNVRS